MKKLLVAATVYASMTLSPAAFAADSSKAPASVEYTAFNSAETPIGDLLDNKDAKALLDKILPVVAQSDQIDMARGMTLRQIQTYSPDEITDAKLAELDAGLATLPKQ